MHPKAQSSKPQASHQKCMKHTGPAKVYDSEKEALTAIRGNEIKPGDVVVIRYEGPRGGPGMPEMLFPTATIAGMGLAKALP